ncbi:High-affinity branched-chain amino acid transport ATP-binding protein BraG [Frankia canadensis]|uniref:High-affinity branched-chain amino acid transport ATP-binding protein BraG n=1 Tax=Frankia canadensis TaxID=1836972 RepID=A0A2I2KME9_9ACTN|nr:ATP-binding cassette domain-containing protein [Frankia canadensis]SNQ46829.1 High-affinity branched-chain amino acid transport ATP-binding protein BraG [Frankia canadensis]SOU54119.1 High-affinity branched-chain amino acid transport ATP-binding protein BraG [Frankia canadensis]
MTALVEARKLCAGYQGVPVVRDLDLTVEPGEVVALLGPNGAGKTTTLLTLAGELRPISGDLLVDGEPSKAPLHKRAGGGLGFVPEERSIFMSQTTAENLRVGRCDVDRVLELFPELKPKLKTTAGLLSGGEQQMLSLGRALARGPRLLLADELSLGLAPLVVARLLAAVRAAADTGVGALLVEQHVRKVLEVADRVYVLRRGVVDFAGTATEAKARLSELEGSYLSGGAADDGAEPLATSA